MQDKEQEAHAARLSDHLGTGLVFIEEKRVDQDVLAGALSKLLNMPPLQTGALNLDGAETAAKYVAGLINKP